MVASSLATHTSRAMATDGVREGGVRNRINVGDKERLLSIVGGGLLTVVGLRQGSLAGLGMAAVGGSLLYRGLTGHCHAYGLLGVNTSEHKSPATSVEAGKG